jgi:hypothetical protein
VDVLSQNPMDVVEEDEDYKDEIHYCKIQQ